MGQFKFVTILLILSLFVNVYGFFKDDFNTAYPAGESGIPGQNGWVTSYNSSNVAHQPVTIHPTGRFASVTSANYGSGTWSGAGRDIRNDVVDGVYEVRMAVYGQYHAPEYADFTEFSVGNNSLIASTANANDRDRHTIHFDNRNSQGKVYLGTVTNGSVSWSSAIDWDKDAYVWAEVKIYINMNTGTATAYWRDLNDTTLLPTGTGVWTSFGNFPGTIPYTELTSTCFSHVDYGRTDNFVSGAGFGDDFTTNYSGTNPNIPGNNGWQTGYSIDTGAAFENAISYTSRGSAEESDGNWGTDNYSGAAREIKETFAGDIYEVSVDFYAQYHAPSYVDQKQLFVGDSTILNSTDNANAHVIYLDDRNSVNTLYLETYSNGSKAANDVSVSFDGADYMWFRLKIVVDVNTDTASAWWCNINNTTHNIVGKWTKLGDFPGTMPYSSPTAVGFAVKDYARADNFTSTGVVGSPVDLNDMDGWNIVLDNSAIPSEVTAANELQDLIYEAFDVNLPIVSSASGTHHIFVGAGSSMTSSNIGFSVAGFDDDKFRIKVGNGNIAIAGGNPRGTLYGVYTFLEDYVGVRFLTEDHTYVPTITSNQMVGPLDRIFEPPFKYLRHVGSPATYSDALFAARCRQNHCTVNDANYGGVSNYGAVAHTFNTYVPIADYNESHPEYFAMWDGVRQITETHTNLCMTNSDVVNIMADGIVNTIDTDPNPDRVLFSAGQNDNIVLYCTCSTCAAINSAQGNPGSGALLTFVNNIAAHVIDTHGRTGVKIGTFAYGGVCTRRPPTGNIVPRSDVVVQLSNIEICQLHSIDDPACSTNVAFKADLEGWAAKCTHDNLFLWMYGTNAQEHHLPFPVLNIYGKNFRIAANNGVTGMYLEMPGEASTPPMQELRDYLATRLMWDPTLETQDLINEFTNLHYGSAAPYIRDFITLVDDHYASTGAHCASNIAPWDTHYGPPDWTFAVDEATAEAGAALFDEAIAAADNDTIRMRVIKASIGAYRAALEPIWNVSSSISEAQALEMKPYFTGYEAVRDNFTVAQSLTNFNNMKQYLLEALPDYDFGEWYFHDNLTSYSKDSGLNGNGGWVNVYDLSNNACNSALVGDDHKFAGDTTWGDTYYSGAGRSVTSEVALADSNVYDLRMCVYGKYYPGPPYVDLTHIYIGGNSVITNTANVNDRDRHVIEFDHRINQNYIYLGTQTNGSTTYNDGVSFDPTDYPWIDVKIVVDMDNNIASAYWHPVETQRDLYLCQPTGDGSWTKIGDFPGSIPYSAVTAIGFDNKDYGLIDCIRFGNIHGDWETSDDFDTYTADTTLNGNNGWVDAYSIGNTLYEDVKVNSSGQVAELGDNWGDSIFAGAGRDITGDIEDVNGVYEVRIATYGQYHAAGYVDYTLFSVGDDSLITSTPTAANRNRHELHIDNRNSVGEVYLGTVDGGTATWSSAITWNKDDYVWSELKIVVDVNNNTASAYWRDVDDSTLYPEGAQWTKFGDFPGSVPYDALTAVSFAVKDYGRVDNFRSGAIIDP